MSAEQTPTGPRFVAAIVLALVALGAAGLITLTERATRERIEQNRQTLLRQQFEPVLAGVDYDTLDVGDPLVVDAPELSANRQPVQIWRALRDGRTAAVAAQVSRIGYSGPIVLLVGIDARATVTAVRVVAHRETPGIGDPIERDRSDWITGFDGLSLGNPPPADWRLRDAGGNFDGFTGASITPRAVVTLVGDTLLYFERNRERLIATSAEE
ncbi:MAG: RnfABCDGE type electron transport complex subunit G [Pseudomonadota bacterium]